MHTHDLVRVAALFFYAKIKSLLWNCCLISWLLLFQDMIVLRSFHFPTRAACDEHVQNSLLNSVRIRLLKMDSENCEDIYPVNRVKTNSLAIFYSFIKNIQRKFGKDEEWKNLNRMKSYPEESYLRQGKSPFLTIITTDNAVFRQAFRFSHTYLYIYSCIFWFNYASL